MHRATGNRITANSSGIKGDISNEVLIKPDGRMVLVSHNDVGHLPTHLNHRSGDQRMSVVIDVASAAGTSVLAIMFSQSRVLAQFWPRKRTKIWLESACHKLASLKPMLLSDVPG